MRAMKKPVRDDVGTAVVGDGASNGCRGTSVELPC